MTAAPPGRPADRHIDRRILDIYDELTESERRLAEVVLETQGGLHGFTASELAARARVSNATAARFFRRLGYASYGEARRHSRRTAAWGSPLSELTQILGQQSGVSDFAQHIAQDTQNLTRTLALVQRDQLARAVDILARARTIWTVGFRNSYALACYARGILVHVTPDVRLLPVAGMTMAEDIASLKPSDALLVIGFRRRPVVLRELMVYARAVGAPIVLVTDLTAARTAELATVTLRCHNRGSSLFDSYAAPISLINYLCSSVGQALSQKAVDRLDQIEKLHERLDPPSTAPRTARRPKKQAAAQS